MRHEKAAGLLGLARTLASSAEGLTLDEMATELRADRRTAERIRDAIRSVFPQMEEIQDGPRKRFRISGGLDGFMQAPTADELAELHGAIRALRARLPPNSVPNGTKPAAPWKAVRTRRSSPFPW